MLPAASKMAGRVVRYDATDFTGRRGGMGEKLQPVAPSVKRDRQPRPSLLAYARAV